MLLGIWHNYRNRFIYAFVATMISLRLHCPVCVYHILAQINGTGPRFESHSGEEGRWIATLLPVRHRLMRYVPLRVLGEYLAQGNSRM